MSGSKTTCIVKFGPDLKTKGISRNLIRPDKIWLYAETGQRVGWPLLDDVRHIVRQTRHLPHRVGHETQLRLYAITKYGALFTGPDGQAEPNRDNFFKNFDDENILVWLLWRHPTQSAHLHALVHKQTSDFGLSIDTITFAKELY